MYVRKQQQNTQNNGKQIYVSNFYLLLFFLKWKHTTNMQHFFLLLLNWLNRICYFAERYKNIDFYWFKKHMDQQNILFTRGQWIFLQKFNAKAVDKGRWIPIYEPFFCFVLGINHTTSRMSYNFSGKVVLVTGMGLFIFN